jgi:hypothetical protein
VDVSSTISGDGGFLFSAMELETTVRLRPNLVHIVWIDGTYDMVAVQELSKYKRTSGIDFGPVDVVKFCGSVWGSWLHGRCARSDLTRFAEGVLGQVLRKAFENSGTRAARDSSRLPRQSQAVRKSPRISAELARWSAGLPWRTEESLIRLPISWMNALVA